MQEKSKQYQHFSYGYTGATKYFEIDILPVTPQLFSPNIKVFVNTELVKSKLKHLLNVNDGVKIGGLYVSPVSPVMSVKVVLSVETCHWYNNPP